MSPARKLPPLEPLFAAFRPAGSFLGYVQKDAAFRLLLAAGLLARIVLAFVTTNSNDMAVFGTVALDASNHRPLYADSLFSYPPLWGFLFESAGKLVAAFHQDILVHIRQLDATIVPGLTSADLTTPLASFALKLPALITDAALTGLLYRVAKRSYSEGPARLLALAWWLNPLPLLTGSVQASWDSAVPLSILAAIALALGGRWFGAGTIIAAGIAAKLAPLYAIFLIPALAATQLEARGAARVAIASLAGAAAATAIILAPIVLWRELSDMLASVFTRAGTFGVGGANLFAFAQLAEVPQVNAFLAQHRGYATLLPLVCLASCTAIAIRLVRSERRMVDHAVACFGLFASLILTSPFAQPSYAIWLIPFALFAALEDRRWWWIAGGVSALGAAFFLAVRAPQTLLVPWCVFFANCDAAALAQSGYEYSIARGLGLNSLQVSIDVIAGEALGLTMLTGLIMAYRFLGPRRPDAPANVSQRLPKALSAIGLVALAALSLAALAPFPRTARLDVSLEGRSAVIAASGYSGDVHVVLRQSPPPKLDEIDVYFDRHYGSLRGVTLTFSTGFSTHFVDALERHDVHVRVEAIDAAELRGLLSAKPAGHCLLVLGGTLPASVRSRDVDLLEPWVRRGGTLFWAGGPFDRLSAQPNAAGSNGLAVVDPRPWWSELYGSGPNSIFPLHVNIFAPPIEHGTYASPAWYGSRIDFDRTTFPLNVGPLQERGGRALAYVDEHDNSSVSTIPYGRGTIVYFADSFNDEVHAARTIAQLLFTTAWFDPDELHIRDGYVVDGGEPLTTEKLRPSASLSVFGDQFEYEPSASIRAQDDSRSTTVSHDAQR